MAKAVLAEQMRHLIRCLIQLPIGARLTRFSNNDGWFIRRGLCMDEGMHVTGQSSLTLRDSLSLTLTLARKFRLIQHP
jgi:hypothetical protein